ncbi:Phenylalanine--tRNA ligase alpha subunit [Candidatus Bealeia paramacronuclearis]|uniref:Phenylalanine--tRNA ligase alpha subunit n=1 Tax=Candidatus Bealeia paramacronuclearis TaxID=1921001 RepID=A0ABZ2C3Z2_9PROT|nr:Phenylalanine--tRNA ligase alpha subunit [Candidatus Bealeia paramacronuclearis]
MSVLHQLKTSFEEQVQRAQNLNDIESLRVSILGKKGTLTEEMKSLGSLSPEERKSRGGELNTLKDHILSLLEEKERHFEDKELNEKLASETIDISLPPRPEMEGKIHPISQAIDECIAIFGEMGFTLREGPDIESDFHNFSALNIPAEHPARAEQDTFYLPGQGQDPLVLRTHTSPVQIRTMLKEKPPLRIICPGRVYRSDYDATHSPMFHQIEGLVIDKSTHMGHLKGCLEEFLRRFFGDPDLQVRFRPGYFPFTEPSAEVDVLWKSGNGDSKWLEILGCGMVHPNVLKNCEIDPQEYQGFAFGMGIERIAMLKYGIDDLRLFFDSDLRWLQNYGFGNYERSLIS